MSSEHVGQLTADRQVGLGGRTPGHEGSEIVAELESCLTAIRKRHPDVPEAVITVEVRSPPIAAAFLSASRWRIDGHETAAIVLFRWALEHPAELVFAALLHEAAHGLAHARGLQDTSRQGRYHNRKYEACAEELGFAVERTGDGHS